MTIDLVALARQAMKQENAGRQNEIILALDSPIAACRDLRNRLLETRRRAAHRRSSCASVAALRKKRIAAGLCRDCGLSEDEVGRCIRCELCRDRQAADRKGR